MPVTLLQPPPVASLRRRGLRGPALGEVDAGLGQHVRVDRDLARVLDDDRDRDRLAGVHDEGDHGNPR
jgi:hypothetical protein